MRVRLRKVGNSMVVTVPNAIVEELGLAEGTELDVAAKDGEVVLARRERRWDEGLADLRAQAKARGLTEADVDEAIRQLRGRP